MRILVACEESQAVTIELRKLGHEAYSNDLIETSGEHPEWHLKDDCIKLMYDKSYNWDMVIAFPPCTYLTVTGARWLYHPDDKHLPTEERRPHPKHPNRKEQQKDGLELVRKIMNAPIDKIAIENPVGAISTNIRKPDQIIQPYEYGDSAQKTTCIWLKGLPKLLPTNIVDKGEIIHLKSGKSMSKWFLETSRLNPKERAKIRSKTFPGIAKAMAEQWTKELV